MGFACLVEIRKRGKRRIELVLSQAPLWEDKHMSIANDTSAVFDAALALPREKREELVRQLVISIDADQPKHPDYDRLWAEEIQKRWAALESGEDPGIDHDEAMRRKHAAVERGRKA